MHKYEMGIIINSQLEEEAIQAEQELVTELITRFGGVIEKVDVWGRRKLAYEIQKMGEGFYVFFYVDGPPTMPREVESRINIRENIIRHLIIRRDDIA
ncbi:MAG: 30S ribosomal protein S6 [Defluviitaleaceae bacterium]|nr:30S ribosomal protein S6 [Defluviitaleaceae bacterium]